jgi:hypothetical protein
VPFLIPGLILLLPLAFVVLLPFSIVQRYRVGTARRLGRSWIATLNVTVIAFSSALFVWAAALTSFWLPRAFPFALAGLFGGGLLGLLGLRLTRWEPSGAGLHYTPNRPLVLLITIGVAVRVLYGFWRGWHAWENATSHESWLAASGAASSLGIGGVVLGYYLVYWAGVRRRLRARGRLNVRSIS